jgi:hypothetical protein
MVITTGTTQPESPRLRTPKPRLVGPTVLSFLGRPAIVHVDNKRSDFGVAVSSHVAAARSLTDRGMVLPRTAVGGRRPKSAVSAGICVVPYRSANVASVAHGCLVGNLLLGIRLLHFRVKVPHLSFTLVPRLVVSTPLVAEFASIVAVPMAEINITGK